MFIDLEKPLYSFGTLMDPDLLYLVSGQEKSDLLMQPASVMGFQQRQVLDEEFPVLVPAPEARTLGLLITGLNEDALKRIQFFEGEEYELQALEVDTDTLQGVACQYFCDKAVYQASNKTWELEQWQINKKRSFLARVEKYMALYGAMTAAEADGHW